MAEDHRIWGLSLAHLLTDFYSPILSAVLPLLILTHGFSYMTAGLLVTIFNLTSSVTQPFFGWFSDRRGKGIPVPVSLAISAVFIGLIGIAPDFMLIALCAGLGAIGHAIFHPSAMGAAGTLCTNQNRGRLMSYFVIGGNLGYALGPLFAGIAVELFGLPGILILAIPGLLMAVLGKRFLPDTRERCTGPLNSGSRKQRIGRKAAVGMGILVCAAGLRAWVIFASIAYLPALFVMRGFDLWMANLFVTLMLLAGVAGQVIGGTLSDRYGRKEYTIAGMLLAIPPFWIFLSSDGILSMMALFVFGFFLWSTFAVSVAIAHELLPGNIGLASGLVLGLAIGGGGIGVAITGSMADAIGLVPALHALVAPIAASILLFVLLPYPWRLLWQRNTSFQAKS
ncbi:MAG: MFS transporter [Methanomicrobiales archaeon]|nr:MFS transporter [Methanomicrobiales archaeon]